VFVLLFAIHAQPACAQLPAELADAFAQNRLLLFQTWTPDPTQSVTLVCGVLLPAGHREHDLSRLVIYRGAQRIFSLSPLEFPLSIFPTAETNGNLATVWVSADGSYYLWVFSFSGGIVKQVLKAASKLMPEFVYAPVSPGSLIVSRQEQGHHPGGPWNQRIIVSNLEWILDSKSGVRFYEPVTADIYVWNGDVYRVRKGVRWTDRLTAR
jgi:hypothetical protein